MCPKFASSGASVNFRETAVEIRAKRSDRADGQQASTSIDNQLGQTHLPPARRPCHASPWSLPHASVLRYTRQATEERLMRAEGTSTKVRTEYIPVRRNQRRGASGYLCSRPAGITRQEGLGVGLDGGLAVAPRPLELEDHHRGVFSQRFLLGYLRRRSTRRGSAVLTRIVLANPLSLCV